MRLFEFEGKDLLKKYGIPIPDSIKWKDGISIPWNEVVIKAQVLTGGRGKAGLVKIAKKEDVDKIANEMLGKQIKTELVKDILLEEKIPFENEIYVGLTYDTDSRSAVLLITLHGGVEVNMFASTVHKFPIYPNIEKDKIKEIVRKTGIKNHQVEFSGLIQKAINCFFIEDCRLLEINPIGITKNGLIALDSHFDLEEESSFRHKDRNYPLRMTGFGRPLTEREEKIKEINMQDYRGTVKYVELDGDIGFLAAGGGGSITCMDALTSVGGKPSNYTEFSGNPSDEKVYELTKVILSKPGLNGLWIVGAVANFTLMDTTMSGVIKALGEVKPKFPIVVRRSGPNEKEGIQILKNAKQNFNLDMTIYGAEKPMTSTAIIMKQKAEDYGNTN